MNRRFPCMIMVALCLASATALSTNAHSNERGQLNAPSADPRNATTRLFHTGLGIGARLAHVTPPTTAIILVSEGMLVLGDTVEAGVEVGRESMDTRLLAIAHNQEVLRELRKNGRLRRGDREFAATVASLRRDLTEFQGMDAGDYFTWALSSHEAKMRMIRVPVEHYATAFLGKWIAKASGVGPRIASSFRDPLHVRRNLTRAAWKKSDGFARMMGNSLEELFRRLGTVDMRLMARDLADSKDKPSLRQENNTVSSLPFEPPVLGVPLVVPLHLVAPVVVLPEPPPVAIAPLPPQVLPIGPIPIGPLPPLPPLVPLSPPPATVPQPMPQPPPESSPQPDEPPPSSRSSPFRPGDMPTLRQLDRINRSGNW